MNLFYLLNIDDNYITKHGEIISDNIIEKKSKFICYIFNIKTESEALNYIEKIKVDNKYARHVVYVYSYLDNNNIRNIKYDDDFEPTSTGTRATIETIQKENLINICIVIVRYFGGILLGVGPLSRAYLNSVKKCINNCIKNELYEYVNKNFTINYSKYNNIIDKLNMYSNKKLIVINSIDFGDLVNININISKNVENEISNIIL